MFLKFYMQLKGLEDQKTNSYQEKVQKILQSSFFLAFAKNLVHQCFF